MEGTNGPLYDRPSFFVLVFHVDIGSSPLSFTFTLRMPPPFLSSSAQNQTGPAVVVWNSNFLRPHPDMTRVGSTRNPKVDPRIQPRSHTTQRTQHTHAQTHAKSKRKGSRSRKDVKPGRTGFITSIIASASRLSLSLSHSHSTNNLHDSPPPTLRPLHFNHEPLLDLSSLPSYLMPATSASTVDPPSSSLKNKNLWRRLSGGKEYRERERDRDRDTGEASTSATTSTSESSFTVLHAPGSPRVASSCSDTHAHTDLDGDHTSCTEGTLSLSSFEVVEPPSPSHTRTDHVHDKDQAKMKRTVSTRKVIRRLSMMARVCIQFSALVLSFFSLCGVSSRFVRVWMLDGCLASDATRADRTRSVTGTMLVLAWHSTSPSVSTSKKLADPLLHPSVDNQLR